MAFSHLMACNNKSEPFVVCNNFRLYLICAHIAHKRIEAILFGRCCVTQCFLLFVYTPFYRSHVCGRMCAPVYNMVNVTLTIDWCGNVFSIFIYFYSCTFWARTRVWARRIVRERSVLQRNSNGEKITQTNTYMHININTHYIHKPTTWKYASTIVCLFAGIEHSPQMT